MRAYVRDGSDAIADWPILNALLTTAGGASWVSVHQGGGVGMGKSIHAGQVIVADGSPLAADRLRRVLTADPGIGVVRHADAGYPRAVEVAAAGIGLLVVLLRLGMLNSSSQNFSAFTSAPSAPTKAQRLQEIENLRASGALSDDEYTAERGRIISSI